jgi:hypothetical protein
VSKPEIAKPTKPVFTDDDSGGVMIKTAQIPGSCESPAFECEEDCKSFIEYIQLALRLEDAQDYISSTRAALRERFEAAGGSMDNDADCDVLLETDREVFAGIKPEAVSFKTTKGSERFLWQAVCAVPPDAYKRLEQ